MKVFDEIDRDYSGPSKFSEPEFKYLNSSAHATIDTIRQLLETWFSRFPVSEPTEFLGRFRSSDDWNHRSAFFELLLHELVLRLGCQVTVHPDVPTTSRKLDFLVESPNGYDFYLEAVHVSGESRELAKSRARANDVYDALNNLDSPNFYINLEVRGTPKVPFPTGKMRNFLKQKLAQLNPDSLSRVLDLGRFDLVPLWRFEHEGWEVTCYPTPKEAEDRGKSGVRPLATRQYGGIIDSETPIRNAVIEKAGSYGKLDLPFVVALNALDPFIRQRDILKTLYGSIRGFDEPETLDDSTGVWGSSRDPKWTRVSAVLVMIKAWPWSLAHVPIHLYHNPRPQVRYTGELTRLPQIIPIEQHLKFQEGESLDSIFNLPDGWPEA